MGESPHYFIGIPVSKEVKQDISRWQQHMKEELGSNYQTWTHEEDLHITLKFLGGVGREQLQSLTKELRNMESLSSFNIEVGGLGTFGKPKKPRVLWAGVERNADLEKLQKKVEAASNQAGFEEGNQPYRPHMTLAKKWKGEKLSKERLNQLAQELEEKKSMHVTSFSLFRIHPSKLPKYEEITNIQLK